MMKKIRTGIFETNSSSVHCICIANNNNDLTLNIPNTLFCHTDDYGWENRWYYDVNSKADYLFTMICCSNNKDEYIERLRNILTKYGIVLDEREYSEYYIDHSYEWGDTIEKLLSNDELLFSFLFDPNSFVGTSNDNGDCDELMKDVNRAEEDGFTVFMKYN